MLPVGLVPGDLIRLFAPRSVWRKQYDSPDVPGSEKNRSVRVEYFYSPHRFCRCGNQGKLYLGSGRAKEDLSAEKDSQEAGAWFSGENEYPWWPGGLEGQASQGAPEADRSLAGYLS